MKRDVPQDGETRQNEKNCKSDLVAGSLARVITRPSPIYGGVGGGNSGSTKKKATSRGSLEIMQLVSLAVFTKDFLDRGAIEIIGFIWRMKLQHDCEHEKEHVTSRKKGYQ